MNTYKLIQGDCLQALSQIENESIDLVIADPPYGIDKALWDIYDKGFNKKWISECIRVLKPRGSIWITLGFQIVAETKLILDTFSSIRLKNWIIWYRKDGWKGNKGFCQSHEHILYYYKDFLKTSQYYKFRDYLNQKREEKGLSLADINLHYDWAITGGGVASGLMGDKEDNIFPSKACYVKIKELLGLDSRFDDLPFGELVKFNPVEVWDDVWIDIRSEMNKRRHPTQKPLKLFKRIISCSTDEGDIVLDPFLGSGTTMEACQHLRRSCIGIEINSEYCEQIKLRCFGRQFLDRDVEYDFPLEVFVV